MKHICARIKPTYVKNKHLSIEPSSRTYNPERRTVMHKENTQRHVIFENLGPSSYYLHNLSLITDS
jgi:hypothetical protein